MNRISRCIVVALALIVLPTGPALLAAEASPEASASGSPATSVAESASPGANPVAITHVCDLWTADEVSAALGGGEFTVQPGSSGAPICFYGGPEAAGDLAPSLYAVLAFGDASTGSLIEQTRQNVPDAEELEIGGMAAIPGPTSPGTGQGEGWSMPTLYVFPDPMVMLQLIATAPEGVDGEAGLASLVELAALRIASIQPPSASPSPAVSPGPSSVPAPSTAARAGLAALFPSDIGGNPLSVDVDLTGPEYLSQIINFRPMEQKVNKALKKRDLKAADIRFAIGSTNGGSTIAAFQVKDGAIKPLVNVLLESLAMERTGGAVPSKDVAGKDAFGVTSGFLLSGGEGYAYPKDDVLWLVFSPGSEQTEIFEKLP